jgi:peptide/nickel transport system ATP-binding protein
MLLDVKNLQLSLASNHVLVDKLSFSIEKGKTLAIVGESGSGKTLTAKSIIGLLPENIKISSGEITYVYNNEQLNLSHKPPKTFFGLRGKSISMIFQDPMSSLNPVLQCGEQVKEVATQHLKLSSGQARDLVMQWFEKVKLPDVKRIYKAYPHELSGGQIQRVMIAQALIAQPQLLIADEPTTALDVTIQKNILDLLSDLQVELGLSILFISHDLGVVSQVADKILVMQNGKMVEYGPATDILFNPTKEYTQILIASRHDIHTTSLKNFAQKDSSILLKISSLSKSYTSSNGFLGFGKSKKEVLHQVSFDIYKGEALGLVGESGSGKSTIGKCVVQLVDFESGEIIYHQKQVNELNRNQLRSIQLIFQDPLGALNPLMSAAQVVEEVVSIVHPSLNKEQVANKAYEWLVQTELGFELHHRLPHELSGGQRQRLVIARALAAEPELLICDEAVSALDVTVQAQILNLLIHLKSKLGLTLLFISHDLSVVHYLCDRIVVLNQGKIEECGTSSEVIHHSKSDYTRNLVSALPKLNKSAVSYVIEQRNKRKTTN